MIAGVLLALCALLVGGCASPPPPAVQEPVVQAPPQPEPPPQQPPPAPAPQPVPPPVPQPSAAPQYTVTTEVYNRTFDEIRTVIQELNTHIARREFDGWLQHLTPEYISQTSRPEYLDKWKDDAELKRRGVVLRTLRDFFDYLVVPRRSSAKLDEIQFLDDTHVYAFTVLQGEKYLLYYLVKTGNGWKVDFY